MSAKLSADFFSRLRTEVSRLLHRNPATPSAEERGERRAEPRWLTHAEVQIYFLPSHGQVEEAVANLVNRSDSGARLWTTRPIAEGERFLIVDQEGAEGQAKAIWVEERNGGSLLGASVAWTEPTVGRIADNPATKQVAAEAGI